MRRTETIIVGGGQAGLALSRCLVDRGRDHVVFERGRIGERWRSERWDSLRLLTPNWMTRLPGHRYEGPDPDGYMTKGEVVGLLEGYARSFDAPVREETTVWSVAPTDDGWQVTTDDELWKASNVVVATGHCDVPRIPEGGGELSSDILQVTTRDYGDPEGLPPGGVLVVGASATGIQLADEIRRVGRDVTVAVGSHTRLPRTYRGRDIMWWLDRMGLLDRSIGDVSDPEAARQETSLQLVGRPDRESLDLGVLADRGVRLAGRFLSADGSTVRFDDELRRVTAEADDRLEHLLGRIDRFIASHGLEGQCPPEGRRERLDLRSDGPRELDLRRAGIRSVVWATGFRREYPWLHAPVLDELGEIVHERGRTRMPGLWVLGMQFMIRRRSSFIDGVGRDAEEIADRIAGIDRDEKTVAA